MQLTMFRVFFYFLVCFLLLFFVFFSFIIPKRSDQSSSCCELDALNPVFYLFIYFSLSSWNMSTTLITIYIHGASAIVGLITQGINYSYHNTVGIKTEGSIMDNHFCIQQLINYWSLQTLLQRSLSPKKNVNLGRKGFSCGCLWPWYWFCLFNSGPEPVFGGIM